MCVCENILFFTNVEEEANSVCQAVDFKHI